LIELPLQLAPQTEPVPDDEDQRQPWLIVFGEIRWTATPRRGYKTWRITDESGALVACCTAKGVARLLAKAA
jgi:hypothetical protein